MVWVCIEIQSHGSHGVFHDVVFCPSHNLIKEMFMGALQHLDSQVLSDPYLCPFVGTWEKSMSICSDVCMGRLKTRDWKTRD